MFEVRFRLMGSKPGAQGEPGGGKATRTPLSDNAFLPLTRDGGKNRQGVELFLPSGSGYRGHPAVMARILASEQPCPIKSQAMS